MALIPCPECGTEVSDIAKSCPKCGYPIKKMNKQEKKPRKPVNPKVLGIAAIAVLVLLAVSAFVWPGFLKPVKQYNPGDILQFGNYPQGENGEMAPIEWIVLEQQGKKALVVSKYGLDAQPYNTEYEDVTWETCTLRAWLNSTFLNTAFTAKEQKAIAVTEVDNGKNQCYSGWDTNGGNNTQDQIFLLSCAEANKYFGVEPSSVNGAESNLESRVAPTAYAVKQGAYTWDSYKTAEGTAAGYWWLRSPGHDQDYAAYVYTVGSLYYYYVDYDSSVVRPALWLDLSGI